MTLLYFNNLLTKIVKKKLIGTKIIDENNHGMIPYTVKRMLKVIGKVQEFLEF